MTDEAKNAALKYRAYEMSRKTFFKGATASVMGALVTVAGVPASLCAPAASAVARPGGNSDNASAGASAGAGGLEIREIAAGVFVHKGVFGVYTPENGGDISNAAFVIGDKAVAVIDTGGTYLVGHALRNAIAERTDLPIRYVINTHMHPDHVFGNAAFKADQPEFVAHYKMARGLAARAERYLAINKKNAGDAAFMGTEVVLPSRGIQSRETLDLGGRELVLEAQPTAHTDNDLVITDTKTETLFLGDLLFAEHCPALDGSILGWLKVIDTLSKRNGARVVPGHGPFEMAWPDALKPERRYLTAIVTDVRKLIVQGKTLSFAMKTVANQEEANWTLFEDFHRRNIAAAFAELEWE